MRSSVPLRPGRPRRLATPLPVRLLLARAGAVLADPAGVGPAAGQLLAAAGTGPTVHGHIVTRHDWFGKPR
jgi:hypothetical protein